MMKKIIYILFTVLPFPASALTSTPEGFDQNNVGCCPSGYVYDTQNKQCMTEVTESCESGYEMKNQNCVMKYKQTISATSNSNPINVKCQKKITIQRLADNFDTLVASCKPSQVGKVIATYSKGNVRVSCLSENQMEIKYTYKYTNRNDRTTTEEKSVKVNFQAGYYQKSNGEKIFFAFHSPSSEGNTLSWRNSLSEFGGNQYASVTSKNRSSSSSFKIYEDPRRFTRNGSETVTVLIQPATKKIAFLFERVGAYVAPYFKKELSLTNVTLGEPKRIKLSSTISCD